MSTAHSADDHQPQSPQVAPYLRAAESAAPPEALTTGSTNTTPSEADQTALVESVLRGIGSTDVDAALDWYKQREEDGPLDLSSLRCTTPPPRSTEKIVRPWRSSSTRLNPAAPEFVPRAQAGAGTPAAPQPIAPPHKAGTRASSLLGQPPLTPWWRRPVATHQPEPRRRTVLALWTPSRPTAKPRPAQQTAQATGPEAYSPRLGFCELPIHLSASHRTIFLDSVCTLAHLALNGWTDQQRQARTRLAESLAQLQHQYGDSPNEEEE